MNIINTPYTALTVVQWEHPASYENTPPISEIKSQYRLNSLVYFTQLLYTINRYPHYRVLWEHSANFEFEFISWTTPPSPFYTTEPIYHFSYYVSLLVFGIPTALRWTQINQTISKDIEALRFAVSLSSQASEYTRKCLPISDVPTCDYRSG